MDVRIEFTSNKHVYARVKDGVLVVRVPRWLPAAEREAVVQRIMQRGRLQEKAPNMFETIRETGEVRWAWGDVWQLDEATRALAPKALRRWLLEEARRHWLPQITAELRGFAVQMGGKRTLGNVSVRDLHSRWGSCTARGDIAISLATLLLPYPLFAYVCAHEVAHLTHLHHQPAFWRHLQTVLPDAQQRRRQLHTHQPS